MANKEINVEGERFELYLDHATIQKRVKAIARKVSADYKDSTPIILCVLNGAFMFYSDLLKNLTIDCETAFLPLSSYGNAKTSTGVVKLLGKLPRNFKGRDILVVEDIVDSGTTIEFLVKALTGLKVRSFRIISLLYKNESVKSNVTIHYIGFQIPRHFVIGYGLDYAQKKRNLRDVYKLKAHKVEPPKSQRKKQSNGR